MAIARVKVSKRGGGKSPVNKAKSSIKAGNNAMRVKKATAAGQGRGPGGKTNVRAFKTGVTPFARAMGVRKGARGGAGSGGGGGGGG